MILSLCNTYTLFFTYLSKNFDNPTILVDNKKIRNAAT